MYFTIKVGNENCVGKKVENNGKVKVSVAWFLVYKHSAGSVSLKMSAHKIDLPMMVNINIKLTVILFGKYCHFGELLNLKICFSFCEPM